MDLALAIENLVPSAEYGGSTTANTEEAFNALRWEDERPKPTWQEIQASWGIVQVSLEAKNRVKAAIDAGFPVSPEGFNLAVDDISQSKFTSYLVLLENRNTANETLVSIKDIDGEIHQLSFARLKEILQEYGGYCLLISMGGV